MSTDSLCSSTCWNWWASSVVCLCLFGFFLLLHIGLSIKYKSGICTILIIAAFLETLGFGLKFATAWERYHSDVGMWLSWQVMVFVAPFFINAFIYTLLSRLHTNFTPTTPLLKIGHLLLPILSIFDIVPLILQLTGLILAHTSDIQGSTGNAGTIILFVGFLLQLLPLLTFVACLVSFHRAANSARRSGGIHLTIGGSKYNGLLHALYWTVAALLIRTTYYIYNTGTSYSWIPAPTIRMGRWTRWEYKYVEVFHLAFDVVMMLVIFIAFASAHPGRFLRRSDARPSRGVWAGWKQWRVQGNGEYTLDMELGTQDDVRRSRGNSVATRGGLVA